MEKLLAALITLTGLALSACGAQAQQQPCQWNYTIPPGANSLATFCGDVQVNGTINIANTNVVTSITALLALPSPINGQVYFVTDYGNGVGGGGQFIYKSSASPPFSDGHCVYFPASGGYWTRILNPNAAGYVLNIVSCGAHWDGATDDSTPAINASTALYNLGGGTVTLPSGTGSIASWAFSYATAVSVNVQGGGSLATSINKNGASGSPVMDFSTPKTVQNVASSFGGFTINCLSKSNDGMRITDLAKFTTTDVRIINCVHGMDAIGTIETSLTQDEFSGNQIGYYQTRSTDSPNPIYPNIVTFNGGSIRSNTSHGMDLLYGNELVINGTDFEFNGTAGGGAASTGAILFENTFSAEDVYSTATINNAWLEAQATGACGICADAVTGLNLTLNNLRGDGSGAVAVKIGAIQNITINNSLFGSGGDVVTLAAQTSNVQGGIISTLTDTSTNRLRSNLATSAGVLKFGITGAGTAQLASGVVTVVYPQLAFGDIVFATHLAPGGTQGSLTYVPTVGTGFVINSSSVTDGSTVNWFVVSIN